MLLLESKGILKSVSESRFPRVGLKTCCFDFNPMWEGTSCRFIRANQATVYWKIKVRQEKCGKSELREKSQLFQDGGQCEDKSYFS